MQSSTERAYPEPAYAEPDEANTRHKRSQKHPTRSRQHKPSTAHGDRNSRKPPVERI
jgi:hypothetical protein